MGEATTGDRLSVAQAAKALGLNPTTVYRLCAARKLGHRRMGVGGGKIVLTRADVDAYLASSRVDVDPDRDGQPASTPPTKLLHFRPQGSRRA